MEKTGSFSQQHRINKGHSLAVTADRSDMNAGLHHQVAADDARYHAEKLGLGGHGAHEGWIRAEEASAVSNTAISAEARHQMISVTAYYLAEKRGFAAHGAGDDWIKAEAETDAMLHDHL